MLTLCFTAIWQSQPRVTRWRWQAKMGRWSMLLRYAMPTHQHGTQSTLHLNCWMWNLVLYRCVISCPKIMLYLVAITRVQWLLLGGYSIFYIYSIYTTIMLYLYGCALILFLLNEYVRFLFWIQLDICELDVRRQHNIYVFIRWYLLA